MLTQKYLGQTKRTIKFRFGKCGWFEKSGVAQHALENEPKINELKVNWKCIRG